MKEFEGLERGVEVPGLFEAIDLVYELPKAATRGLREIIIHKFKPSLWSWLQDEPFRALLLKHSELGLDFLDLCNGGNGDGASMCEAPYYECDYCGCRFILESDKTSKTKNCPDRGERILVGDFVGEAYGYFVKNDDDICLRG